MRLLFPLLPVEEPHQQQPVQHQRKRRAHHDESDLRPESHFFFRPMYSCLLMNSLRRNSLSSINSFRKSSRVTNRETSHFQSVTRIARTPPTTETANVTSALVMNFTSHA